jgi:Histidine kinase-, DNA gyrase B-, and HSP90-like ATPase
LSDLASRVVTVSELLLQASNDLVARLAHESDPLRAVVELIWNAVDAEAWTVTVRFDRAAELEGITALHVDDDGHGISVNEVASQCLRADR